MIASTQIGTVGDYLYQERVRSDRLMMEKLSLQAGVLMDENGVTDVETLLSRMRETGEDLEAERILLLSDTGKVLLDTAEKEEPREEFSSAYQGVSLLWRKSTKNNRIAARDGVKPSTMASSSLERMSPLRLR